MKRILIICMIGIFFLSSVSAVTNCDNSNEELFAISDIRNAHGEIYNAGFFQEEICFSNYFKDAWTENEHACTSDNVLLNLSADSNAHAEKPGGINFGVGACFGDLVCQVRSDLCEGFSIVSGGLVRESSFIVSLSADTNAHLALSERFPRSLCCASKSTDPLCNKDNYCDTLDGENPDNCPSDCPLECEIDGFVEANEQCDCGLDGNCTLAELGKNNCSSVLGSNYEGVLQCDNECGFKTNLCFESPRDGDNFCSDYATDFSWTGGGCPTGDTCWVNGCEDVNNVNSVGAAPYDTVNKFREKTCNDCAFNHDDPSIDPLADKSFCSWNEVLNKCELVSEYTGGLQCRTEWVSEGTCGPEDTTREVEVKYVKISGPSDEDCPGTVEIKTVPCARVVQLPFFGIFSFILSVIMISLIYLIYIRK